MAESRMTSNIVLNNRKVLNLTGVKDVGKFDDQSIIVFTNQGKLKVSGSNLKIGKLSVESGELELNGSINSIVYVDLKDMGSGFFKNLFK